MVPSRYYGETCIAGKDRRVYYVVLAGYEQVEDFIYVIHLFRPLSFRKEIVTGETQ